jgi:hypothetical protein
MIYIVRIELANAALSDFTILHAAMAKRRFSQKVLASDKVWYHLPRATYLIESSISISEVHTLAQMAVGETGKTAEILIGSDPIWFSGLKPVQ